MKYQIVILGAGESGVGAAILAKKKGYSVFVSDLNQIKENFKNELENYSIDYEENKHTQEIILNAELIIKSPGIPDKAEIIKLIKQKNIPIISEIEFAYRFTNAKFVAITGSNGKTTTTQLTYEIFKTAGYNVGLAGNIGKSLARLVANENYDYYVIELSSFQLDYMFEFKADVAILLNITPDHLDRYDYDFQNYINSKFRITRNQTSKDFFVYNIDDEIITNELAKRNLKAKLVPFSINKQLDFGAYLNKNLLTFKIYETMEIPANNLNIKGKHNIYNSLAAGIAAHVQNIKKEDIRKAFTLFKGVEHRLEEFLTIKGVKFINDSKATNVNSVWYALESIHTPIILIMGGIDKGNDYSMLRPLVAEKVKAIVALGVDNSKIINAFSDLVKVYDTKSMDEAVKQAYSLAEKGDTVLLSPACASFDLFENYMDRGKKFKEAVRKL